MKADERRARFGGRNGQIGAEATPAEFLDALLAGDVGEHGTEGLNALTLERNGGSCSGSRSHILGDARRCATRPARPRRPQC